MAYTKIVINSDTKGRVNISAIDDNGSGHGRRLAGPKYIEDHGSLNPAKRLADDVVLDSRDIVALHEYANIGARISFSDLPDEVHELNDAMHMYLASWNYGAANNGAAVAHRHNLVMKCRALLDAFDEGRL